jgi:hypothetical protein
MNEGRDVLDELREALLRQKGDEGMPLYGWMSVDGAVALLDAFEAAHPGLVDETFTCGRCGRKLASPHLARRGYKDEVLSAGAKVRIFDCWICPACAKEARDE